MSATSVLEAPGKARDQARSRPAGLGRRAILLLFVGALDARKDPHALLDAWTTARIVHPDLKLIIYSPA